MALRASLWWRNSSRRQVLHHPIVREDTAYLAWRDAGLVILDVKDRAEPRLVAHKNWSPRALVRPPRKRPSFPVRSRDGGREQYGSRATFCGRTLHGRMLRDFSFVSASSPHSIQRAHP